MYDDDNINSKEVTFMGKIELPLLIISLILSFALEWYAVMVVIAIKIWMNIRDKQIKKRSNKVSMAIHQFCYLELHQVLRDSLELIKCSKMVERGYDSRSNTNIILQEQKMQQLTFHLTPTQTQIASAIISIVQQLIHLQQLKRKLLEQQCKDDEKSQNVCRIESFRDLFGIRKVFDRINEEIYDLPLLYEAQICQPLLDVSKKFQFVKKCDQFIVPLLEELTISFKGLQYMLQNEVSSTNLSQQFRRYLKLLMNEQHHQTDLSLLIDKVNHIQDQITQAATVNAINQHNIELVQGNHQNSIMTATHHHSLPEQPPIQRKQFMKKLDSLLMVGLARKRQEEFQRKMKLLQQQETT